MGSIIKKVILVLAGILLLGGLVLVLVSVVSSKKNNDKTQFYGDDTKVEYATSSTNGVDDDSEDVESSETDSSVEDSSSDKSQLADNQLLSSNTDADQDEEDINKGSVSVSSFTYRERTLADDKEAPKLLIFNKAPQVKQYDSFDIQKYIGYGDDVDRDVDLTVNGEVDTSTLGSYPVNITLSDDAGHSISASMTVSVVSAITPPTPMENEQFSSFISKYSSEGIAYGLDVSRWQENIDFTKVKAAGCDYVIIRLGGFDDGSHYTDKYYINNIKNAKDAGLKVGIYWHAEESTPEQAVSSVKYLMSVLGGESLDFPIAYDWEDFAGFEKYHMNIYDLNACFETFCQEVEKNGYEACLYSSKNFLENVWTNENNHKVWLAHYTSRTDYRGKYYMWQHSSRGRIDGINTDVDFNILYE